MWVSAVGAVGWGVGGGTRPVRGPGWCWACPLSPRALPARSSAAPGGQNAVEQLSAARGGVGGRGRQCPSRGRARHTPCDQPPGGFSACWPARGNKFALCFPRAQPRLFCSRFGPGPACGGNSGSLTDREPGDFVSNDCGCSGLSSKRRYVPVFE